MYQNYNPTYLDTYNAEDIVDIAKYQSISEKSIRLYFSKDNPEFTNIFFKYRESDVNNMLLDMISETDRRSVLVLMARMEAAFRVDYKLRSTKKYSDSISIEFRKIWAKKNKYARLNDILDVWGRTDPETKKIISKLKIFFKFRHWLAHGRYWNFGIEYDFQTVYILTYTILSNFPFYE